MKKYDLTYPQQSIWYSEQYIKGTSLWNIAGTCTVDDLDFEVFKDALNRLIRSNEGLNIRLSEENGKPYQYFFSDDSEYIPEIIEFSDKENVDEFVKSDSKIPMNIIDNRLFEVKLLKFDTGVSIYIKIYHIIADGYSSVSFILNLFEIYKSILENTEYTEHFTYESYILEEQKYLNSKKYLGDEEYWKEKYRDQPEFVYLKPLKNDFDSSSKRIRIVKNLEESRMIRKFCDDNKVSMFNLVLSVFTLYLSKVSGKKEIGLSTTVLNRGSSKMDKVIGMFTNTLPLRLNVDSDKSFYEFLSYIKTEVMSAFRHSKYPYQNIVQHYRDEVDKTGSICDAQITYQKGKSYNKDFDMKELFPDVTQEWIGSGYQLNTLRMNVVDLDDNTGLIFVVDYMTDVFNEYEINKLIDEYYELLIRCISSPANLLKKTEVVSGEEKELILNVFNNTDKTYDKWESLRDIFESTVREHGSDTALIVGDKEYTYDMLNDDANRLANQLIEAGVRQNDIVPIISERSYEMLLGIYGIIKAGAAYLPINSVMPLDRINFILNDIAAKVVMLENPGVVTGLDEAFKYICLNEKEYKGYSSNRTDVAISSTSPAYVIYTSGSTGNPKGVLIEHHSIINRLQWMKDELELTNNDVVLLKTPYTFDVSVIEMFWWTLAGAKLAVLDPFMEKEPEKIVEAIEKYNVTYIHFVPSMLDMFLDYVNSNHDTYKQISSLRNVVASGEALTVNQVGKFKELLYNNNSTLLYNFYGPTEAAVDVSYYKCFTDDKLEKETIPIGKPIANVKIYVLDEEKNILPVGVIGELYISGENVGRGYINSPQMTSERFMDDPYSEGSRMYRTGDLAEFLPDGNIKYIGRNDSQVKIRGYRIELSDIECQLLKIKNIENAAVLVKNDDSGNKKLVAFYQSNDEQDTSEIVEILRRELPQYMIPYYYVHVNEIPLTGNGKMDRKKLLSMPMVKYEDKRELAYAQTKNEEILLEVWKDILKTEDIGTTDDFFFLGGDSIKAIQIIFNLQKHGMKLNVKDFFECKTIREISNRIVLINAESEQEDVIGKTILSPIQKYYFENGYKKHDCFNQYVVFESETPIDCDILNKAIGITLKQHECFRLRFTEDNGVISGEYIGYDNELYYYSSTECDVSFADDIINDIINENIFFDIENGPLCKFVLVNTTESARLICICHHLIIDGISWEILIKDIIESYYAVENDPDSKVRIPKTLSYRRYAESLDSVVSIDDIYVAAEYWNKELSIDDSRIFGNEVEYSDARYMEKIRIKADEEKTRHLLGLSEKMQDTSIEEILMLITAMSFSRCFGKQKVVLMLESHGRELSEAIDVNGTVGWFTALNPVKFEFNDRSFKESFTELKSRLKRIRSSVAEFGFLKYEKGVITEKSPEICFNYFGKISKSSNRLFNMLPEYIGLQNNKDNKIRYPFEINSYINEGKTVLELSYDSKLISDEDISAFTDSFNWCCDNYIEQCVKNDYNFISIADFDSSFLEQEELESIMHMLGEIE